MIKKLTRQECGRKRWANISKEKRSAEMRERANQLWAKIRAGHLVEKIPATYKHSSELEGKDRTREMVRIRDNYTCQDCGKKWELKQRRFDVHHLNGLCGIKSKSYDKVSEINGLITLCHKCHFNRPEHNSKNLT